MSRLPDKPPPKTGYLVPYDMIFTSAANWVQHPEMVEAQTAFLMLLIEQDEIPKDLEKLISGTGIKLSTLRPCVRYAQDRVAEVLISVTELDLECERAGYAALHGKRWEVYRGCIENNCKVPRTQHIGDEAWLASATPKEMVMEIIYAIYERYYMERVEDNVFEFIERNKVDAWRKSLGLVAVVVQRPERKEEDTSKALIKYTGGGRGGKGGRGGGSVGKAEGGSFRGWK